MRIKTALALILASVFLCTGFVACAEQEGTPIPIATTAESTVAETIAPKPTMPENFETAISNAFATAIEAHESQLEWTANESGITITKYNGSASKVKIPETIAGFTVTAIGEGAFAGNETIEVLVLPDCVTAVGLGILSDCTALSALHTPLLGASLTDKQFLGYLFGASTHEDNPKNVPASLQILSVGKGLSKLPDFSIFDCNELIALRLDQSIKLVGTYAAYRCKNLRYVNVDHLEMVADHAFDQCVSLTHVTFGESLTAIGIGAFEGCASMQSMTLPFVGGSRTENTYLAYLFGAEVPDFAKGYYPNKLIQIDLLPSCTTLGNYAFYEFEYLTYLTLPEGLTSVGVRAFDGCVRLRSVSLPNSLEKIGDNAFFGCIRLETVVFGEQNTSRLTQIGINAFYGCSALKSVVLPNALKSLPASCFADCTTLQSIDLGGVTEVGKNTFYNCSSLESIKENLPVKYADE